MRKLRDNMEEWAVSMKEEIEMAEVLNDMGIMNLAEQNLDRDFNEAEIEEKLGPGRLIRDQKLLLDAKRRNWETGTSKKHEVDHEEFK